MARGFAAADLTRTAVTRRGLQRFTRAGDRSIMGAPPAKARARVEINGDGTIALAFTRDGALPGEGHQRTQVPIVDIESAATDFLALLLAARSALGMRSDYAARLTVHPPTEIFRRADSSATGVLVPWDQQRVYGYRPVNGPIIGSADRSALIASWVDMVTDAVNQAGAACALDAVQLETDLWVEE